MRRSVRATLSTTGTGRCSLAIPSSWLGTPATSRRTMAGGVRTAKQALHYLVLVKETLGDAWLSPEYFRFGASALLNDVLMQLEKERTGVYQAVEDFSKD